jgi:hypothetical protein
MAAITFDTHEFIKTLTGSGVPEAQAEAMARAQKEAFPQALDTALATKSDIADLKGEVAQVENRLTVIDGELRLIKWMLALVILVTVVPALKSLFG